MANVPLITVQADTAPNDLLGSSWLLYNGLLLTDVLTESYETQDIRTPDGCQITSIHHILKITGIINPAINSFFKSPGRTNPYDPTEDALPVRQPVPANRLAGNIPIVLEQLLKQDRAVLRYSVGGNIVIDSPEFRADAPASRMPCDSNQGPKPLYCQVRQITGTSYYYVSFGIETWIDPCVYLNNSTLRIVKSHRYSMIHDVDGDTWLTTRTVQGHIEFRPEALQLLQKSPDQVVRDWAHPKPPGFERGPIRVHALPNGMELAYSFSDIEKTLPLGTLSPATKLKAEFSIASSFGNGTALTQAHCHVAAVGPKNQFRMNLLIMAIRLAMRKIDKPGRVMINEIIVSYSLDNTFVDLTMKAIWKPVGIGPLGMQLATTGLDKKSDLGDIDAALAIFRNEAGGEAAQGSNRDKALSPSMAENDTRGTYMGNCIGSDIVNGCFNLTRPANITPVEITGSFQKVTQGDKTAYNFVDAAIENSSAGVVVSVQLVSELTMQSYSTGYSYESTNAPVYYEDYQMTTRYHTNYQRAVLPVGMTQGASPGDVLAFVPPEIATLAFPVTYKSVHWSISAVTSDPNYILKPSPDTGDPDDVLLAEDISPAAPAVCNSTSKAWRISGTFWYVCKKLKTSSAYEKSRFSGDDLGISAGKLVTDPSARGANTFGLVSFVPGYAPKSSPG